MKILEILKLLWSEFFGLFVEMSPYLLLGMFFAGLLHLLISKDIIVKHLGKNSFGSIVKSAFFGVPLPLCSCGVVPTASFIRKSGGSNAATTSFLISTPQTGIDSIIATYGLLGPVMAIFRPLAAFFMGIFGGVIVAIFGKKEIYNSKEEVGSCCCESSNHNKEESCYSEKKEEVHSSCCSSEKVVEESCCCSSEKSEEGDSCCSIQKEKRTFWGNIKELFSYGFINFLKDTGGHLLFGLLIAAIISAFVSPELVTGSIFSKGILAMILMVVIGAPMYVCSTSSIPIAVALIAKGFSPGAAFVFLAAGPATNMASYLVINKFLGKRNAFLYLLSIIVSAIGFGLLLDLFKAHSSLAFFPADKVAEITSHSMGYGVPDYIFAGVLFLLIVYTYAKKIKFSKK